MAPECRRADARERQRAYFQRKGGNPHRKQARKVACEGGCGRMIRGGACRACFSKVNAKPLPPRAREARAKLRKAAKGTRSRWPWVQGECAECGDRFMRHGEPSCYCSKRCSRREAGRRRRALEAGAKITPGRRHAIHVRDRWLCQLCGFPVNRDAAVPDYEAPVIDHIIALAAGGEHGPHNWQTAHFLCNCYKRDLPMSLVA